MSKVEKGKLKMAKWHYRQNGEIKGPFSDDQIQALCEVGVLHAKSEIWQSGQNGWLPPEEIADFPESALEKIRSSLPKDENSNIAQKVEQQQDSSLASENSTDASHALPVPVETDNQKTTPLLSIDGYEKFSVIAGGIAILGTITSVIMLMDRKDLQQIVQEFKTGYLTPVSSLLFAIFWISFLIWLYRSTANLKAKGFEGLRISPGWAVGWWFVPVAFFWKPYQALSQLDRASHFTQKWQTASASGLVKFIWFIYILSLLLTFFFIYINLIIAPEKEYFASSITPFRGLYAFLMLLDALFVLLLITFIKRISEAQTAEEFQSYNKYIQININSRHQQTDSPHSTNLTPNQWAALGAVAGGILLLALFVNFSGGINQNNLTSATTGWRIASGTDPIDDERITLITGRPIAHNGRIQPTFNIRCGQKGISVSIYFGVPMHDTYSKGDADISTVYVRLDSAKAMPLAFVPSRDWATLYSIDPSNISDALSGLAVGLDNLIFEAFGVKNRPKAGWSAKHLVRAMLHSKTMTIRGAPRIGNAITAQYDLRGLKSQYAQLPTGCKN